MGLRRKRKTCIVRALAASCEEELFRRQFFVFVSPVYLDGLFFFKPLLDFLLALSYWCVCVFCRGAPHGDIPQVKWVNKGAERGETFVSISTDGRVVEWSMKKGLSFGPLMVLKRIGESQLTAPISVPIKINTRRDKPRTEGSLWRLCNQRI